jgi:lysophospholipase L1-like esterase
MRLKTQSISLLIVLIMTSILTVACQKSTRSVSSYSDEEKALRMERAKAFGDYYVGRMETFLSDNPQRQTGGVLFLGDSITERFPAEQAFQGENVINRGIGGDSIPGVTDRLDTSVADLAPAKIYLTIGVNDLMWSSKSIEEHTRNYENLLIRLREVAPEAEVTIFSVLPITGKWSEHTSKLLQMNQNIEVLAAKYGHQFVDMWPRMAADNRLRDEYSLDGVHLTLAGYMAWLEEIVPDDRDYQQVVRNLAPLWLEAYPQSLKIDAVNPKEASQYPGGRGPDMLVIFTPEYGKPTTGTNEWGIEATVANGVVSVAPGGNNSRIEPGTFVVSGHGKAAGWVNANLGLGQPVSIDGDKLVLSTPLVDNLYVEYWHAVSALEKRQATGKDWNQALKILKALRQMDRATAATSEAEATAIMQMLHKINPSRYGIRQTEAAGG